MAFRETKFLLFCDGQIFENQNFMATLLLGNPLATSQELQDHILKLKSDNQTHFEQPHRLSSVDTNSYAAIKSCIPPLISIDHETLKGCLMALKPKGELLLTELLTTESQDSNDLSLLGINIPTISKRRSDLILAGFTNVKEISVDASSEKDLSHLKSDNLELLSKIFKVALIGTKPDFDIGASAKISFKKSNVKKIWKISAAEENESVEIENDENLLGK